MIGPPPIFIHMVLGDPGRGRFHVVTGTLYCDTDTPDPHFLGPTRDDPSGQGVPHVTTGIVCCNRTPCSARLRITTGPWITLKTIIETGPACCDSAAVS